MPSLKPRLTRQQPQCAACYLQTVAKQRQVNLAHDLLINTVTAQIERDWRATSFSALSFKKHAEQLAPGRSDEDHQRDEFAVQQDELPSPYSFPKGAKPGSCLHEIFEQLDFTSPVNHPTNIEQNLTAVIERAFEKYHIDEQWQQITEQWVLDTFLRFITGSLHGVPDITRWQTRIRVALVAGLNPTFHNTS